MPAITLQASVLTPSHMAAVIRTQLFAALCVDLLLYGAFIITTYLTIRALVIHKTPCQSWKTRWPFLLAACIMFVIGTCDAAFTIWINSPAVVMNLDGLEISPLSLTNYNLYLSAHVRHILDKSIKL
jgi:hypothetical protein